MDPKEALKAVTINAAKNVRLQNRIGSLEVGKDADMVLYTGHPFDYMSRVRTTFINGKPVYENQEG